METTTAFGKTTVIRLATLMIITFLSFCAGATISITGVYQGQNLKISNPVSDDGFGYSVTKIVVNGDVLPLKRDGNTTEVDFSQLSIQPGTAVIIQIDYQSNGCLVVLTPEALLSMTINAPDHSSVYTPAPDTTGYTPSDRAQCPFSSGKREERF